MNHINPDILLDRKFFNINTRNLLKNEKNEKILDSNKNNLKNQTELKNKNLNVKELIDIKKSSNIIYIDRNEFKKEKINKKKEDKNELKDEKIQNMQFNPYLIKYRTKKNVDRIGFENNNKEQIFYKPYERNIKIENKNLNNLDFIYKNKNTEYYKKINLKKFNPNINYKDFI